MERRVAFCTTCKNRTQHLRETLPRNLADNPEALFIVLNYNSRDELLSYLAAEHETELTGLLQLFRQREIQDGPRQEHGPSVGRSGRCRVSGQH